MANFGLSPPPLEHFLAVMLREEKYALVASYLFRMVSEVVTMARSLMLGACVLSERKKKKNVAVVVVGVWATRLITGAASTLRRNMRVGEYEWPFYLLVYVLWSHWIQCESSTLKGRKGRGYTNIWGRITT